MSSVCVCKAANIGSFFECVFVKTADFSSNLLVSRFGPRTRFEGFSVRFSLQEHQKKRKGVRKQGSSSTKSKPEGKGNPGSKNWKTDGRKRAEMNFGVDVDSPSIKGLRHGRRRGEKLPLNDENFRRMMAKKKRRNEILRAVPEAPLEDTKEFMWFKRTPAEMKSYLEDDKWQARWRRQYSRVVEEAIIVVRQSGNHMDSKRTLHDQLRPFSGRLTLREMCIVLKKQNGWIQMNNFFEWMQKEEDYKPCTIVFTILLQNYGRLGMIESAESTWQQMIEAGCEPDHAAYNTLIHMYGSHGVMDKMIHCYESLLHDGINPNIQIYVTIISKLTQNNFLDYAVNLWNTVQNSGIPLNDVAYYGGINLFFKCNQFEKAVLLFEEMKKQKIMADEFTCCLIIRCYGRLRMIEKAMDTFNEMRERNLLTNANSYLTMSKIYKYVKDYSNACSIIREMMVDGLKFDANIYAYIISLYGDAGMPNHSVLAFNQAQTEGIVKDEKLYVSLIHAQFINKKHEKAIHSYMQLQKRSFTIPAHIIQIIDTCYKQVKGS